MVHAMMKTQFNEARWIGIAAAAEGNARPSPFLRKAFRLAAPVRQAVLHWTALGLAEVSINGQTVGDAVLAPGWSDFRSRVQALSVDVTGFLNSGDNVLGAILGDGWYCGHMLWKGGRNHYGTEPRFLARLDLELENGERVVVLSGSDWQAAAGAILESDLYHGETYDARRELPGWSEPGGGDGGPWEPVAVFSDYEGIIEPKRNEPARCTETLMPVSVTPHADSSAIFDFGQNFAGVCRLRVKAPAGTKVVLHFAEMLNDNGSLYRENLRTARATDTYICRGGGVEEWTPRFTFHGFRYVGVTGLGDNPPPDTLLGLVWHSDMPETGSFECSNPDINQLESNIRWGMRSNFLDVPTDCPQRDERLGWTGDAQVFIGTAAFHYDVSRFFEKWMCDLVDGQRADGAFPHVAPDLLSVYFPPDQAFGAAAWADAGVICPWQIYRHFGNTRILEENYGAMTRWIDYQEKTARGFLRPPTTYGDWLAIDAVTPERAPVPSDLVGTACFAYTTGLMARIAAVLGRDADTARFTALREQIVAAFQREYVTPGGRVVGDCQTGCLLALAFDLLPEELRPRAVERLVELIACRDWHLTTGFVGTPLLCPVLSRFGHTDVAYKLLLQDTYPSWLYPIRNGATTMWERWNSYTKEHGFGPVDMNSFNHYAYGAIGEWMYATIGGLRCLEPGYRSVLIAPEPGGGITSARCSHITPQGRLACSWQISNATFEMEIEVPDGIEARFRLPHGYIDPTGNTDGELAAGATRICGKAGNPA